MSRSKSLSQKDAVKTAVAHFVNAKESTISQSDTAAATLFKKLFERIVKNKQKLFLISAEKVDNSERLRELLHFRFIHLVNPSFAVLDEQGLLPRTYAVFSLDYGKLASLKVAKAGEQLVQLMSKSAEIIGRSIGTPFLTGYIVRALKDVDIGDKLVTVAGTIVVSSAGIDSGNVDADVLVKNCVYDDLV